MAGVLNQTPVFLDQDGAQLARAQPGEGGVRIVTLCIVKTCLLSLAAGLFAGYAWSGKMKIQAAILANRATGLEEIVYDETLLVNWH